MNLSFEFKRKRVTHGMTCRAHCLILCFIIRTQLEESIIIRYAVYMISHHFLQFASEPFYDLTLSKHES